MKLVRSVVLLFLAVAVLAAGMPGQDVAHRAPFPKITVAAKISSPGKLAAVCPYTLKFKGEITVNMGCNVTYKIVRSDGGVAAPVTLHFAGAGTQVVNYTWTLGATLVGWVAIQVTVPVSVTSNHGDFALACVAKAAISKATLKCGGAPCSEVDFAGTGFGAAQGVRKVMVDGVAATNYLNWSDTAVTIGLGGITLIYWDHVYQFSISENGNTISNVYSTRFPIKFDAVTPTSGTPNSIVTLQTWGGGSQADGRVIKIGNAVCPVVSWTTYGVNADIKVRVPSLAAGMYKLYFQRGADIISDQVDFKVL